MDVIEAIKKVDHYQSERWDAYIRASAVYYFFAFMIYLGCLFYFGTPSALRDFFYVRTQALGTAGAGVCGALCCLSIMAPYASVAGIIFLNKFWEISTLDEKSEEHHT